MTAGASLRSANFFQVDAFAAAAFSGNPAAVCLLDAPRSAEWMQSVAMEMNLSETAFVVPATSTGGAPGSSPRFSLRWFTPAVEVKLCGHATLASAHALWASGRLAPTQDAIFDTKSGELRARLDGDWIELDFPRRDARRCEPPPALLEALGVMPSFVGRNDENDYLLELADEDTVRSVEPDMPLLLRVDARGIMVTARAGGAGGGVPPTPDGVDFVSRFFGPAAGVPEDPVTGSAHCCLAPYWAPRLKKDAMLAFQASRRGGVVRVRVEGERVRLAGRAVTVVTGTIEV